MKKSRLALVSATVKSQVQLILGLILVPFGLIGVCFYLPNSIEYGIGLIIFMFILLTLGLFLLWWALRTKKLISQFRHYVCILSNQSSMSIFDLSQTLGKQEKEVMDDVQAMIDRRFFAAAYIDHKKKCLIFPLMEKEAQKAKEEETNQQHIIVSCSVCGGDNKIVSGKTGNCIFCHNFIQG